MSEQAAPGWYPDAPGQERYWDGAAWTASIRPHASGAPASPPQPSSAAKSSGVFSRLKQGVADMQATRRETLAEAERSHAEAEAAAGRVVTTGVFGTSTIEIYEGAYVRIAVGDKTHTEAAKITKKTPFEKLRSIKFAAAAADAPQERGSALDGVVGSAVSTLFKGGAGLMKSSVPGLAVAGVAHLASAESRRAYLTIATDRTIHNLTNESHSGVMVRSVKAHNEVGAELARAGASVLGEVQVEISSHEAAQPIQATAPSLADRLRELAALHQEGVLSDEEFAGAKASLLAGL